MIRVFPRRTNATPDDDGVVVNRGPSLWDEADEVQVSVTFEWDRPRAESLAKEWAAVAPVLVGGPAYSSYAGEFIPGQYLRHGYVITSRGCPNRCSHCLVPTREGALRLLPIKDGWNVLDNNLLACPRHHQEAVFQMLLRQPSAPCFTGGFEARRVTEWHAEWMVRLKPETLWMAYDRASEWEPLVEAVAVFKRSGLVGPHKTKRVGAYVLMGWAGDDPLAASKRLQSVIELGIRTQAMLLDNGRQCRPTDMGDWWDLRKKYTNAAEVGAMVAETWDRDAVKVTGEPSTI